MCFGNFQAKMRWVLAISFGCCEEEQDELMERREGSRELYALIPVFTYLGRDLAIRHSLYHIVSSALTSTRRDLANE